MERSWTSASIKSAAMSREKRGSTEDPLWSTRTVSIADWPELAYRELVSRIVSSPIFARSERLSTLLTYVCDMALKGRDGELNEQRIGHAVFGRSPDYDSSVDGIVRTQASRLRQRLDLYFEQEGVAEPVRVVIPRGGYVPVFMPQHAAADPGNLAPQSQATSSSASTLPPSHLLLAASSFKGRMLPWVMCVLLVIALATIEARSRIKVMAELANVTPHPLWSQIFTPQHPTLEGPW